LGKAALIGKDAKLYMWNRSPGTSWQEIADFTSSGLKDITRLDLARCEIALARQAFLFSY